MENKNEALEIDLLQLLRALWKNKVLIIIVAVIFAASFFVYSAFIATPMYEAESLIYINASAATVTQTPVKITTSDITASETLVDLYIVILKTRLTLEEVISEADLDITYKQLSRMISAEAVNGTQVFSVTVEDSDPRRAQLIANTIANILPDKIEEVIEGSSTRVVDYAIVPTSKSSPSVSKYTAIGLLLGIVISGGIIVLREILDNLVHGEEYLIETYGLPVLAVIPDMMSKSGSSYYSYGADDSKGVD